MTPMRPKLAAGSAQQRTRAATDDDGVVLETRIRGALEKGYLRGRKLVGLKIRRVEGKSVEGFLKIDAGKDEHLLVDFRATSTEQGGLSYLEVGGRKISVAGGAATTRLR